MKKFLLEALAILALAGILGAGVHHFRGDPKLKIPFIGEYPDALKRPVPPASPSGAGNLPVSPGKIPAGAGPAAPGAAAAPSVSGPAEGKAPPAAVGTPARPVPDGIAGKAPAPADLAGTPTGNTPAGQPKEDARIRDIFVEQAYEEFKNGSLFVDARRTKHYEEGHVPRARLLSVWEADYDERFNAFLNDPEITKEMPIVVYCSSFNCEDSHRVAERLADSGFANVLLFRGGFPEWAAKEYEVEKGAEPAKGSKTGGRQ